MIVTIDGYLVAKRTVQVTGKGPKTVIQVMQKSDTQADLFDVNVGESVPSDLNFDFNGNMAKLSMLCEVRPWSMNGKSGMSVRLLQILDDSRMVAQPTKQPQK